MTQSPFQTISTPAAFSRDGIQIYASLHSASGTICTVCSLIEPLSSPLLSLNPGLKASPRK